MSCAYILANILAGQAIDEIGWTPYHWKLFLLNGFGYVHRRTSEKYGQTGNILMPRLPDIPLTRSFSSCSLLSLVLPPSNSTPPTHVP